MSNLLLSSHEIKQMETAAHIAERGYHHRGYRLGAVLVKNGSIIGIGWNQQKTHPIMSRYHPFNTLHAEAAAMADAGLRHVGGATIYIARIGRRGDWRMAKPCRGCFSLLLDYGIKQIVWTETGRQLGIFRS
jgi:deoxycytidylate deaminase